MLDKRLKLFDKEGIKYYCTNVHCTIIINSFIKDEIVVDLCEKGHTALNDYLTVGKTFK